MDIELDYSKLGKRIKEQRLKKHLTQEKLAEIVNIATSNISHIERATTACQNRKRFGYDFGPACL